MPIMSPVIVPAQAISVTATLPLIQTRVAAEPNVAHRREEAAHALGELGAAVARALAVGGRRPSRRR